MKLIPMFKFKLNHFLFYKVGRDKYNKPVPVHRIPRKVSLKRFRHEITYRVKKTHYNFFLRNKIKTKIRRSPGHKFKFLLEYNRERQ